MTGGIRHRLARLTLRHRLLSLGIILAVTAFFAAGLTRVELRTIFSDLFPKNHPFVQTYKDHPNFGNPLTVTVMVKRKDGDIYNAETLATQFCTCPILREWTERVAVTHSTSSKHSTKSSTRRSETRKL